MVVSGSSAGIVKLWDLKTLLGKSVSTILPLRRISMKGVLHYPIKDIFQFSYTDLVIVAKYEANRKKDKIKVVQVSKQQQLQCQWLPDLKKNSTILWKNTRVQFETCKT